MKFEKIQKQAKREWEAFNRLKRPRILIGAATCGRAAGALSVRAAFEKELAARSIEADLYDVGCFGMCYAEPLVEIGLPGSWRIMYKNVTEEMAAELVKTSLKTAIRDRTWRSLPLVTPQLKESPKSPICQ